LFIYQRIQSTEITKGVPPSPMEAVSVMIRESVNRYPDPASPWPRWRHPGGNRGRSGDCKIERC